MDIYWDNEQSKEYKLYHLVTKKTIITRHVKFVQDQAWNDDVNITLSNQPFPHVLEPTKDTR